MLQKKNHIKMHSFGSNHYEKTILLKKKLSSSHFFHLNGRFFQQLFHQKIVWLYDLSVNLGIH